MYTRTLGCLVLALGISASSACAQPRVVLELFTSQSCSACPPADRLFTQLAQDPDFLVLSLPVDYWDRTGWRDTFAKHEFTIRQQSYAQLRGDSQAYTPQVVINGRLHAVGSDRPGIIAASQAASSLGVPVMVQHRDGTIVVDVGGAEGVAANRAAVVALPIFASREVAIGRGENAHSKVTYTNIVRDIIPLGEWSGTPVTISATLANDERYDGIVVLLQEGSLRTPGQILGADYIRLR